MIPSLSSLYQSIPIPQQIAPFLIGERTNANGSKKFRERLLADDFEGCLSIARDQEEKGAHAVDLCVAYAGRNEVEDMKRLVSMFIKSLKIPLVIDSTHPDCVEAALKIYPGRCLINSINLEDGGRHLDMICRLVKKYGAAVIALTINENGMAMTVEDKLETVRRIYKLAVDKYGLRPYDLFFDPLTFTIGSGDETLRDAAKQTLLALERIKAEMPDSFTILGISNVSYGLRPASRKILNSVFLHQAVEAGLDAAIIDTSKVIPMVKIDPEDREACMDLIYNRKSVSGKTPLVAFIEHFEKKQADQPKEDVESIFTLAEKTLQTKLLNGDGEDLDDLLTILLQKYTPMAIVNDLLIPEMRHIGALFGKGEILLPFVLQSAEIMNRSVQFLKPFMEKADLSTATKILLATVRGDVHDIGKNLVEIILTNNGYQVFNIGIKVPEETIIQKARENQVDLIGLSGLLVKSALVMQEGIRRFAQSGLDIPILLGGAALTEKFVAQSCVPLYHQPVIYCRDAFAGLKAVQDFEDGVLKSTHYDETSLKTISELDRSEIEILRNNRAPDPPFWGSRVVTDIDTHRLFPYINQQALFRGRWGYRKRDMTAEGYQEMIDTQVMKLFEDLKERCIGEQWIQPRVVYGYFKTFRDNDRLILQHNEENFHLEFPRQSHQPYFCIADFFKSQDEGGDVAGFFVVTVGDKIADEILKRYESDRYHDYLILHGFGAEMTDALAEYWHDIMLNELGIQQENTYTPEGSITRQVQGCRFGVGYPSWPDLDAQRVVFEMLQPERIGISLTDSMEMVPEQTTSAIIAHHPQAKYFAV